jgi:hypothetical protein
MIVDKGSAELERHVRVRAARAVIRMCPDHGEILPMLGLAPDGSVLAPPAPPVPDAASAPDARGESDGPDGPDRGPGAPPAQCRNGHPKSGENLRIAPSGRKSCRACESAARRARRERERERARARSQDRPREGSADLRPDPVAAAVREASAALGISGRRYRREYGASLAIAEAVLEAVRLGDAEMVELLRKRPAA